MEKLKVLNQNSVYSPLFFLAGFIYFFDRMMLPRECRLSLTELSLQKLHLISPFQPVKYSGKCGGFMEK